MGKSNANVAKKSIKVSTTTTTTPLKAKQQQPTKTMKRKEKVYILDDCIRGINEPSLDRVSRRAGVTQTNKSTRSHRRVKDKKTGQYIKVPIEKEQSLTELRRADIKYVCELLHKDAALFAKAQGRVTITEEDVKKAVNTNHSLFGFHLVA